MADRLNGGNAIVTGAAGGAGNATAGRFAAGGPRVAWIAGDIGHGTLDARFVDRSESRFDDGRSMMGVA